VPVIPAARVRASDEASTSLPVRPARSSSIVKSCIRFALRSAAVSPAGASRSPGRST
jgi:hypothetical protein